jgi:hypothetical protein
MTKKSKIFGLRYIERTDVKFVNGTLNKEKVTFVQIQKQGEGHVGIDLACDNVLPININD